MSPSDTTALALSILKSTLSPYKDNEQEAICERLVSELTLEEQELAARTSYAYWLASTSLSSCPTDADDLRKKMAMREARRHLVGQKGDYDNALSSLRGNARFRKERHIDIFRTCFQTDTIYITEEETEAALRYRTFVEEEMSKQVMLVRGMDVSNRSIVLKFHRQSGETTDEAYIMTQLYIAERAIAATEFLSQGKEEKVSAIFDFADYNSAHSPPRTAMQTMVVMLQRNYPERLHQLIVVDAPFWMRALFKLMSPFLNADVKAKVIMIYGDIEKESVIGPLVGKEQAMPFMIPNGQLSASPDVDFFLQMVPFHCLYDHRVAEQSS